MKYVLYIDYENPMSSDYRPMEAKNFREAIEEAEAMFDPKTMYLVRIMEKRGKVERQEDGWKVQMYEAIECKRNASQKWHRNDEEHDENEHFAKRTYKGKLGWIECVR